MHAPALFEWLLSALHSTTCGSACQGSACVIVSLPQSGTSMSADSHHVPGIGRCVTAAMPHVAGQPVPACWHCWYATPQHVMACHGRHARAVNAQPRHQMHTKSRSIAQLQPSHATYRVVPAQALASGSHVSTMYGVHPMRSAGVHTAAVQCRHDHWQGSVRQTLRLTATYVAHRGWVVTSTPFRQVHQTNTPDCCRHQAYTGGPHAVTPALSNPPAPRAAAPWRPSAAAPAPALEEGAATAPGPARP